MSGQDNQLLEAGSALLSQAEVEALLDGPPGGGPLSSRDAFPAVQQYDFRRPDKLSKEQARTLQMLHESFARLAGLALSASLRTTVQVNLMSTEHMPYEQYVELVPEPAILNIVRLDPLPGNVIVEFGVDFAFAIVDRLMGGTGRGGQRHVHEVTDIELLLLGHVASDILGSFREAWANIVELTAEVENTLLVSRFAQVALPTDVVMVATFEGHIAASVGLVRLCIPFAVLEPILPKLSAQLWFERAPRAHKGETAAALMQQLGEARLAMTARLGVADLTVEELLQLRPGDVVRLDSAPGRDMELLVNGRPTYRGRPGLQGKRLAVQVTDLIGEMQAGGEDHG